jgi:phosphatidyl-myo-inositol dimannoside synthase
MKVLFIAADINQVGGIEQYNRAFLDALRKAGVAVSLIELKGRGLFPKVFFTLKILARQVTDRPDIILCAHINFSPVCHAVKKIFGTPYTVSLYGIDAINVRSASKLRAVSGAERVIVISEYTEACILKQLPGIKAKIYILPTAIDDAQFFIKDRPVHFVEKYHLEDCPVILTIARLNSAEHKGYDRVMKALPLVLKEVPRAKYVLVGKGSDVRVDELLKNPLIKEHVVLTGRAENDELIDYYNLADVFVMPSKFEGFGIVHKEALLCGRPVIASDEFGGREALLNDELGLSVSPDNIEGIASAIVKVLTKKVSSRILDKEWVRAKAIELYGIGSFNERVERLVHLLAAPRP